MKRGELKTDDLAKAWEGLGPTTIRGGLPGRKGDSVTEIIDLVSVTLSPF